MLGDGTLQFEQELAPSERYQYGKTLAADGAWAAAGESSARVHVLRLTGNAWNETQLITLADVVEPPGVDVRGLTSWAAMQGDLLALGNHTANVTVSGTTTSNAGAVVLFRRNASNLWQFEAVLVSPTPSASAEFGTNIAVAGNTVIVGAPSDKVGGATVGGAYVFQRSGNNWSHTRTLRNPDAEETRRSTVISPSSAAPPACCCRTRRIPPIPAPSSPTSATWAAAATGACAANSGAATRASSTTSARACACGGRS